VRAPVGRSAVSGEFLPSSGGELKN
jgi:hypothetical protein